MSEKYWKNICNMQKKQTEKGIKNYGTTLEENQIPDIIERIEYAQEEMIDFLMYCEWIKDRLLNDNKSE